MIIRAIDMRTYFYEIVGLRNRIVHDFKSVRKTTLWTIMVKDIPELNAQCRKFLRELDPTAEADLREELGETFDAELNLGGDNDADDRRD